MNHELDSRDIEVVERRASGHTLAEIAADLGLSRERVRQLEYRAFKFSILPVNKRAAALDIFIAPYLEQVQESPTCALCGSTSPDDFRLVCPACRKSVLVLRRVAARLRAFKHGGGRHYLGKAAMEIKRAGLAPNDMRRG